jgi:hypothetical protein
MSERPIFKPIESAEAWLKDKPKPKHGYYEPYAECPKCGKRVYAEYVDIGFGPFSQQADPYYCPSCGWIETGCPAEICDNCKSWNICKGRSRVKKDEK